MAGIFAITTSNDRLSADNALQALNDGDEKLGKTSIIDLLSALDKHYVR